MAEQPKSKKVEQGEQTRAQLIDVARVLFADRGFASTSTEDIVKAARATRGALYHHFDSKEHLFEAVFERVEEDLVAQVNAAAMKARTPLDMLRRGISAFLDQCLEPAMQRIVLRDGLSVLGWDRWYEIDERYALGSVAAAVQAAIDAGQIAKQPVAPLAHLILGAMNHAGLYIAGAAGPAAARKEMERALRRVIDGLTAGPA